MINTFSDWYALRSKLISQSKGLCIEDWKELRVFFALVESKLNEISREQVAYRQKKRPISKEKIDKLLYEINEDIKDISQKVAIRQTYSKLKLCRPTIL